MRWFGFSSAPVSKCIDRFARQYRYSTKVSPDVAMIKLSSPTTEKQDTTHTCTHKQTHTYSFTQKHMQIYMYICLSVCYCTYTCNKSSMTQQHSEWKCDACKQATTHAHVQSVTLNVIEPRTHKKSNWFFEIISATTKFEFESATKIPKKKKTKSFELVSGYMVNRPRPKGEPPPPGAFSLALHCDETGLGPW